MASTLEAGTLLAHYRILGQIGAGGMGEVYKAHDSRLERAVALKILPPDLVRNEERRRRFMQEAKSASSLNHPHIITIHEIGEGEPSLDGAASGHHIHFIAMELVEGSTLGRRIHQEAVELRLLLGYLAQAADGLAKAHAAGIVHRDLKPDNIMVTRDGFAKVLDFGLAKLSAVSSPTDSTVESSGIRDHTREGTLIGTVAYMAPEQVQGKVVDHRSDIFSFGSILYEAATRKRPFQADSDVELMHKILHDKPQPVDELNASVPNEVRRMIRRCMAKDPERRYQSMKDVAIELRELVEEYEDLSASSSQGTSTHSQPVTVVPRKRGRLWMAAAAVLLIAAAAGAWFWPRGAKQDAAPSALFASMQMQPLTFSGNVNYTAISPDAKYVANAVQEPDGRHALLVRQVATGSDVRAAQPGTRFSGIGFSPDGNYLYYSRRDDEPGSLVSWLYQVPTLGGTPRKLIFDVDTGVSFSPDGKQLAFGRGVPATNDNQYLIANVDGSGQRVVTTFKRFGFIDRPLWSLDGKKLVVWVGVPPAGRDSSLVEVDIASGGKRNIGLKHWWFIEDAAWQPDGKALLLSAVHKDRGRMQLWRQPYPDGEPVRLTNDLNDYHGVSISGDGKSIATMQRDITGELVLASVGDTAGGVRVAEERSRRVRYVRTSASGALVYEVEGDRSMHLAIIDQPGATPRRLTSDEVSFAPAISGDGRTVAHSAEGRTGVPHVFTIQADGTGSRQLTNGDAEYCEDISPNGSTVIYYNASNSLWKVPVAGGEPTRLSDLAGIRAAISPDSKKVALLYFGDDAVRPVLHMAVLPLEGGKPLSDFVWRENRDFQWHPKGDGFTVIRDVAGVSNIYLQPLDGSKAVPLTRFTTGRIRGHAWMADSRLALIRGETQSDVVLVTGFQ